MKILPGENSTILVLERGEELMSSLDAFLNESKIKSAWLSGLGAAEKMTIGYYDLETREYVWSEVDDGVVEILSLVGNLSQLNDEPLWHIHGTFSNSDLGAFGGHIKEMYVGLTCEIQITQIDVSLKRDYNEETGLNLLS